MIYLDSTAIIKLVHPEPDSTALAHTLQTIGEPLITSELSIVEVHQGLRRCGALLSDHDRATALFEQLPTIPVAHIAAAAGALVLEPASALYATHLASAEAVPTSYFVTYDSHLARAADSLGYTTITPRQHVDATSTLDNGHDVEMGSTANETTADRGTEQARTG